MGQLIHHRLVALQSVRRLRALSHGFSLIELLVVLVLVGLVGTVTVLNLPERVPSGSKAALRFTLAANRAQDAAILTGTRHGILLSDQGWQVLHYRGRRWGPAASISPQTGIWSEGLLPQLEGEGGALLPLAGEQTLTAPQIQFDSLGLSASFTLHFGVGGGRQSIRFDGSGQIRLEDQSG